MGAAISLTSANSAGAHSLTWFYKRARWFSCLIRFEIFSLPASSYFITHKIYVKINDIRSLYLSLKSFPCLPNDVVNQKIIKNHLGCNLPFSPSTPLPVCLQGTLQFMSLPPPGLLWIAQGHLLGWELSQSQQYPQPCPDSPRDSASMHDGWNYKEASTFGIFAYFP